MKFFKTKDFYPLDFVESRFTYEDAAIRANAKLAKEGRVVYGNNNGRDWWFEKYPKDSYQALLINIEPINKCEHPREKLKVQPYLPFDPTSVIQPKEHWQVSYRCECGARVEPTSFEEIE